MSIEFLTDEQLEDMTGYKRPSEQRKVLDNHGIFYIVRPTDGKLRVTPEHIYNPNTSTHSPAADAAPDFSSMPGVR